MTLGFLLALAAGFVWSVNNVTDKVLLHKLIRSPLFQLFVFTMTSFLLGIVVLPFTDQLPNGGDWFWMITVSTCFVIGTVCYFKAIQNEEPSRVAPLFSLTLVFLTILSAVFLSEIFSIVNYFGIASIAVGSFIIASRGNILDVFRNKAFGYMAVSAVVFSVGYVVIKHLLNIYSFWDVFAYQRLFIGAIGFVIVLVFFGRVKKVYRETKPKYIAMSFGSETVAIGGALLFIAATSLWFVTLVETVASVQYLFIFAWAIIISRFKPELFKEEINRRIILQKIISIALIIVGIYLIV